MSRARIAVGTAVLIALVLRLWHIAHGLPDFAEEAIPFRRAFEMSGWRAGHADLNPHLFHYPSLSFYLHFAIQHLHYWAGRLAGEFSSPADYWLAFQINPSGMAVMGRLVGVAADAATVVAAGVLAERLSRGAGLLAAMIVALAPSMIATSRLIYCDPLMAAFSLWALERLTAYADRRGRASLITAVVLIGLAAGAKYPAGSLVLPLAWVLWKRHGVRGLAQWPAWSAAALLVFLLTTPYALLDWHTFVRHLGVVGQLSGAGHLGNTEDRAFGFHAGNLVGDLGWIGVLFLLPAAWGTITRRSPGAVTVWIALLAIGAPIAFSRIEVVRYLVAVTPMAAVLAAVGAVTVRERWPFLRHPLAGPAFAALLLAPVAVAGVSEALRGGDSTQLQARRWFESHLEPDQLLVQEWYGATLRPPEWAEAIQSEPAFARARKDLQARFATVRTYHSVTLPLLVVGSPLVRLNGLDGRTVSVPMGQHVVDLNRFFYDLRLFTAADLVLTSESVRGRFAADPARFRAENALYRWLDSATAVAARFVPGHGVEGPQITVYRLSAAARAELEARAGALDPLWWAEAVPMDIRRRIEASAVPAPERTGGMLRTAEGAPAAWVGVLSGFYREQLRDFSLQTASQLAAVGSCGEARRWMLTVLTVLPADVRAWQLMVTCADTLGDWVPTRLALEHALARLGPSDAAVPDLQMEHAWLLYRSGDVEAAIAELRFVAAHAPAGSAVARRARAALAELLGPNQGP